VKGFTISGPNGPLISVCHAHGEAYSKIAALGKLTLPATKKCPTCGYRIVQKSHLLSFFKAIEPSCSTRARTALVGCIEEIEPLAVETFEILDDYVWCENKHG
jgi:hypothetical protein